MGSVMLVESEKCPHDCYESWFERSNVFRFIDKEGVQMHGWSGCSRTGIRLNRYRQCLAECKDVNQLSVRCIGDGITQELSEVGGQDG